MDTNYSIADLATITNGCNGNMGGSLWFIILFFLIFNNNGWGNRGYGNGDFGTFATAASQNEILLGQRFSGLDNKIDRIGNGIADATFSLNNSVKDGIYTTTNAVKDTAYATTSAVVGEGRATQEAIGNVRYDMANFAASINSNIDNKFAALEKSQLEQRLADQATQINQLQLAQAMCGVPKISTYAWGTYPYTAPCGSCGCAM